MTSEGENTQLQIRFVTTQDQYSVPDVPFAVASSVSQSELNKLVNQLLRENPDGQKLKKTVNFDFLVANELLRNSLGEHLKSKNVSSETVVEVEYMERLPAPEPKDCLLHDDWVASVHILDEWIISGCFDSTVHIWTSKGKHQLTIPGHTSSVKAVSWVKNEEGKSTFVSGSHDQTLLLWEWNVDENVVECVHVCQGHTNGVECVGVSTDKSKFASGSLDNMLKIWSAAIDVNEEENSPKRSKKELSRGPLLTLKGHKEGVSTVKWPREGEVVTASIDHSIRLWDVEVGNSVSEIAGNKAFLDIDVSPFNGFYITASTDKHIRLYDPKSAEGSLVKSTFSSHSGWVKSVRWSTTNQNLFVSGSYDNLTKMWDVRSPLVPLYDLRGHEDKVLCCDWSDPDLIISGGSDNTVRIFKTKNVGPT